MMKYLFSISFLLAFFAFSQQAVAQNSESATTNVTATKTTADDKAEMTGKKSCCASKASADAGKASCADKASADTGKSCCASKGSASASADATMVSETDGAKKACCASGEKKDCSKGKGAKAEATKDI